MLIKDNEIPIIEVVPNKGYWEIYPDRKIWHDEDKDNHMKFSEYKKTGEKYDMGGGNWMNLEVGDNRIRVVSEFVDYGSHYNPATKKSVICIGKEECPLCIGGDKARVQYLGFVIDRKDGKVKLLRFGFSIFKQIGEYAKNDEYAFDILPEYDITIKKEGQGLETEYSVIPARKNTELTEEEQEQVKKVVKDPSEIIESMKAKVSGEEKEEAVGSQNTEEEEVKLEDIPF